MYKEPKTMREIHEIQERLSAEEKGLSVEQRVAKTRREVDEAVKKYGLKLRRAIYRR